MAWSENTQWADPVETLPVAYLETPEEAEADRAASAPIEGEPEDPDADADDDADEPSATSRKPRRRGRKQAVDESEIPPEVLARRKKKAFQAKLIIYGAIGFLTLVCALLATLRLPGYFPQSFPEGLPPWNLLFPEWYVPRERAVQIGHRVFYPSVLEARIAAAKASLETGSRYYSESTSTFENQELPVEERMREAWRQLQTAKAHLEQVGQMLETDRGLPNTEVLDPDFIGLRNRVERREPFWRGEITSQGITDLPVVDPLPPIPGDVTVAPGR